MRNLTNMSTESQPHQITEWFQAGWAFILAIVGWVWHAGRLASKLDTVTNQLEKHLEQSNQLFKENGDTHKVIAESITSLKEDVAYLKGNTHKNHRSHESDE